MIQAGLLKLTYLPTDRMPADALTKQLPRAAFEKHIKVLTAEELAEAINEPSIEPIGFIFAEPIFGPQSSKLKTCNRKRWRGQVALNLFIGSEE